MPSTSLCCTCNGTGFGGSGTITFTVLGCYFPLPGVSVTITAPGGATTTGTTNGSGQYAFSGGPAGTYSYSVTAPSSPAGYASTSGTFTYTGTGNASRSAQLPPSGSLVCPCNDDHPTPPLVTFTCKYGSGTFARNLVGTVGFSFTAFEAEAVPLDSTFCNGTRIYGNLDSPGATIPVSYSISCVASGYSVTKGAPATYAFTHAGAGPEYRLVDGGSSGPLTSGTGTYTPGSPLNLSVALPEAVVNNLNIGFCFGSSGNRNWNVPGTAETVTFTEAQA